VFAYPQRRSARHFTQLRVQAYSVAGTCLTLTRRRTEQVQNEFVIVVLVLIKVECDLLVSLSVAVLSLRYSDRDLSSRGVPRLIVTSSRAFDEELLLWPMLLWPMLTRISGIELPDVRRRAAQFDVDLGSAHWSRRSAALTETVLTEIDHDFHR